MINKKKIFDFVQLADKNDSASRYFDVFIISLILLNAIAIVLESIESLYTPNQVIFYYFEVFSVIVFSIEYLLRIYSITESDKFKHAIWGRVKYSLTPLALIDLFAVLPFFLLHLFPDLRFIRILRLFRLARLLKLFRFLNAITIIDDVLKKKKDELIISFLIILKIVFISSTIMYYCEHEVQPDKFSSIPESMWWGVMTLSTVGYGDVYPITAAGKIIGSFISLLCVSIFALPTAILASGFSDEFRNRTNALE